MASDFETAGKNNVPLHPESQNYLKQLAADAAAAGGQPDTPPTIEQLRQLALLLVEKYADKCEFSGTTRDITIPSKRVPEGIPIRVYKPSSMTSRPLIIVFYHSGGHVLGGIETCDHLCRVMSGRYGCIIVNVEYRRAPEVKLPEIIKDCEEAARWALVNKKTIGGDRESLVGVTGSSAGGHLAGCVSHSVPGLSFQVMVYPVTDFRFENPSVEEFGALPTLDKNTMLIPVLFPLAALFSRSRQLSLGSEEQKTDPTVNLLLRDCYADLPPALTLVAGCDTLRDDGILYSKKLEESGCHSEMIVYKGAVHGYFDLTGAFKDLSEKSFEAIGEFLQRIKTETLKGAVPTVANSQCCIIT